MGLDPAVVVALVAASFGAAFVNGVIGFGFALLAVNALAAVLGAKDGIIVLSLLTPLVSGLHVWRYRVHSATVSRLSTLVLAAVLGTVLGARILVLLPGSVISLALGLFTAFDALIELRGRRAPLATGTERRLAPVAGFVGGISNGTLGAAGPVLGTYLIAIGLRGGQFAFAISVVFFAMSIVRTAVLAGLGQYTSAIGLLGLILLVPSVVGQRVGFWLRGRLPAPTVERAVLGLLLLASLNLLYRGVEGLVAAAD
jgi:uncharacterized membrane protein YfcA